MQPPGEQPRTKLLTDQYVGAPGVTVVWGAGAADVVDDRAATRSVVVEVIVKRILMVCISFLV